MHLKRLQNVGLNDLNNLHTLTMSDRMREACNLMFIGVLADVYSHCNYTLYSIETWPLRCWILMSYLTYCSLKAKGNELLIN